MNNEQLRDHFTTLSEKLIGRIEAVEKRMDEQQKKPCFTLSELLLSLQGRERVEFFNDGDEPAVRYVNRLPSGQVLGDTKVINRKAAESYKAGDLVAVTVEDLLAAVRMEASQQ